MEVLDFIKEKSYGIIISKEKALQEILSSGNNDLLDDNKFKELNDMYEKLCIEEI